MHLEQLNWIKKLIALIFILLIWSAIGFVSANSIVNAKNTKKLDAERTKLSEHGKTIAFNINEVFGYFRGTAQTVSAMCEIDALSNHKEFNAFLNKTATDLGADVIWIVNSKGITIASSNYLTKDSFVGKNYKDREYFITAMQGRSGFQYAMGKVTHIAGLFFSEPIIEKNQVVAVAVTKLNIDKLSRLLVENGAMLTDENGIVILARDTKLTLQSLPGSKLSSLSPGELNARYMKSEFTQIPITNPNHTHHSDIKILNQHHLIQSQFKIEQQDITLHLLQELPFLDNEYREKTILFVEITFIGFSITFALLFLILNFLKDRTFRAIFNNSAIGIVLVDNQYRFLETNQEFRRYTGYSIDELCKLTIFDITAKSDLQLTHSYHDEVTAGTKILERYEKRYISKSGQDVWVRVSTRRILNWKGHPRFIGFIEDITEQKRAETLLKEQELKMIGSAKMSALGEMASGIAHEINNPLAIIKGLAEQQVFMIEEDTLTSEKLERSASKIIVTVGRIAKIIAGLRGFAREGGHDPLVSATVASIVDETLAFCAERLKIAHIDLSIKIEPPDLSIYCRPSQISQVLLNLLNNSHDALAGCEKKSIQIGARQVNKFIEFWVQDSGPGIPPDIREKIMQPFFTTKEVGHGTGLGLSISSGILASHKGEFQLDPQLKPTRFIMRFPVYVSNEHLDPHESSHKPNIPKSQSAA
jgi:PAS domain S-box-containing protein